MSYTAPILPAETSCQVLYTREAIGYSEALLARPFHQVFHELINGYEEDTVLPACETITRGFLHHRLLAALDFPRPQMLGEVKSLKEAFAAGDQLRRALREVHERLSATQLEESRRTSLILLNRSPAGLTEPCWLDNVSQPATQPAKVVNDLFRIYGGRLGNGELSQSASVQFRALCARHGVFALPEPTSPQFADHEDIAEFAYLGPCYRLAVGRHPRLFLPEIIGTTLGHYMLHMDPVHGEFDGDLILRQCAEVLRSLERMSLSPRWPTLERRILTGFEVEVGLEWYFWHSLRDSLLARTRETPRDRMCKLVRRVARFAGEHHHSVALEGRPLGAWLTEAEHEPTAFVDALGRSAYFDQNNPANSKFFQLLSIDGPMFAIFSKADGKVIKEWAQTLAQEGSPSRNELGASDKSFCDLFQKLDDSSLLSAYTAKSASKEDVGLRELFYRLINVDFNPYILPFAKAYVTDVLRRSEHWLTDGRSAKYSDATFFEYSPAALDERIERVYFEKLLKGYRPIGEMPPKSLVVTMQTMLALGSLIDGAWIHKFGKVPQYGDQAAHYMFGIYADEMGYGDMRLNHIMIARRVLDSMEVDLPEMAERDYAYNDSVPEKCFAFLAYQMAISQFPQTYFAEGLGLNLAVEMFGLGQVRLDEVRKLNHYGFDDSYERLHLTIDNVFSGHVKIGVQAIHSYLDNVRIRQGRDGVAQAWRRVWLGYASMAQFVE